MTVDFTLPSPPPPLAHYREAAHRSRINASSGLKHASEGEGRPGKIRRRNLEAGIRSDSVAFTVQLRDSVSHMGGGRRSRGEPERTSLTLVSF